MEATEFCKYFDFSLEKEEGSIDGVYYNYRATDDQGVFDDRLAENVADLADMFDSMLFDYVDSEAEYYGFTPSQDFNTFENNHYYKEMKDRLEGTELKSTILYDVICVLVDPDKLENDLQ